MLFAQMVTLHQEDVVKAKTARGESEMEWETSWGIFKCDKIG